MISPEAGSAPATDDRPQAFAQSTPQPERIVNALITVAATASRALDNFLALLTLEAKRAALSLMWMVGLGVAAALLAVTAWLGMMAALACGVVALGLPWGSALVVVALINVLAAFVIVRKASALSAALLFPATRRQLATIATGTGKEKP